MKTLRVKKYGSGTKNVVIMVFIYYIWSITDQEYVEWETNCCVESDTVQVEY